MGVTLAILTGRHLREMYVFDGGGRSTKLFVAQLFPLSNLPRNQVGALANLWLCLNL